MPLEHTRRKETQKYLRKSCYHRIKCTTATFLAAFMWRRLLNSAACATTTHKKLENMSDETGTQVKAQMTNECRVKMIQRELYNARDPPWKEQGEKLWKEDYSDLICTCTKFQLIYMNVNLLGRGIYSYLCQLFYSNYLLNSY